MTRALLVVLLQAALLATLPGLASAYEVKPISAEQAAEYKLEPAFYQKGLLVQDILIATSKQVSDHTLREAAYQFDMVMKTIKPDVAGRIRGRKVLCVLVGKNELTSDTAAVQDRQDRPRSRFLQLEATRFPHQGGRALDGPFCRGRCHGIRGRHADREHPHS